MPITIPVSPAQTATPDRAYFSGEFLHVSCRSRNAGGKMNVLKLCETSTLHLEQKCVKLNWVQDLAQDPLPTRLQWLLQSMS